jgi:cysteinyl-tRNA synthetase
MIKRRRMRRRRKKRRKKKKKSTVPFLLWKVRARSVPACKLWTWDSAWSVVDSEQT